MATRPRIEIEYCTQCRWLLRSAWMAQELLTTFEPVIGEVALLPGSGGVFEIRVDAIPYEQVRSQPFWRTAPKQTNIDIVTLGDRDIQSRLKSGPADVADGRNTSPRVIPSVIQVTLHANWDWLSVRYNDGEQY